MYTVKGLDLSNIDDIKKHDDVDLTKSNTQSSDLLSFGSDKKSGLIKELDGKRRSADVEFVNINEKSKKSTFKPIEHLELKSDK